MKNGLKYHGTVVPVVTPVTAKGELDEAALGKIIEAMVAGGVEGIFVAGTTGEGVHVSPALRRKLVERAVALAAGRTLVYVGMGDLKRADFPLMNDYFALGADTVVVHPPITEAVPADQLDGWYRGLLDHACGPVLIYNIPAVANLSIPLDAVQKLAGHPRLAGIKDSENNPPRIEELLTRFGGKSDFAVFIGVGALMEKGLKLGADGIVPSVGNLIPDVCHQLCDSAQRGDWVEAGRQAARMNSVAALYQKGRTLGQSLSALKAAMHSRGVCALYTLPPLAPVSPVELETIRNQMSILNLLG